MTSNRISNSCVAIAVVILSTQISARAGFKRINPANPKDPMAVQIYEVDNGLRVYLTENHETPRFEAQIAVRAGSKNDPPESTGLAHYLEHMLFKGTTRIGTSCTNSIFTKPTRRNGRQFMPRSTGNLKPPRRMRFPTRWTNFTRPWAKRG